MSCRHVWHWELCLYLDITDTKRDLHSPLSHLEAYFATKLQLEMQSSKAAIFLSKIHQHADISIIQQLFRELDGVKDKRGKTWSEEAEFELIVAQLNVYAFQLQQMSPAPNRPSTSSEKNTFKNMLIHLGFTAAIRAVYKFSSMTATGSALPAHCSPQAEPAHRPQKYLPKHYYVALLFAASFIFKTMANSEGEDCSRNDVAANHIRLTYEILSSCSDHPLDEFGRAARMIDVLSRASNLSRLKEFRSHGGASVSVLDETVQTAREMRESIKATAADNSGPRDETPVSVGADQPSTTNALSDSVDSWPATEFDGMNDFDFNWNLSWGFDMTYNL